MRVYQLAAQEGIQRLEAVGGDEGRAALKPFLKQSARFTDWKPVALQRLVYIGMGESKLLDITFIGMKRQLPLLSAKVQRDIADSFKFDGQWLDVEFDEYDYKALNLTNVIDALDVEHSDIPYFEPGRITTVNAYAFKPKLVMDQWLFRDSTVPNAGIFCTDRFVELAQKNAWTGFGFVPLWDSELEVFPERPDKKFLTTHPELYGPHGALRNYERSWPDEWRINEDGSVVESEHLVNELTIKPDDRITVLQSYKAAYLMVDHDSYRDTSYPILSSLLATSMQLLDDNGAINGKTIYWWKQNVRGYLALDDQTENLALSDDTHTLSVLEGYKALIAYLDDLNTNIQSADMQIFIARLTLGLAPRTKEPIQSSSVWRGWISALKSAIEDDSTAQFITPEAAAEKDRIRMEHVEYLERVTGTGIDTQRTVPAPWKKTGQAPEVRFEGYDNIRNILFEARDRDDWPAMGDDGQLLDVGRDEVLALAEDHQRVFEETGTRIEWHVPTQEKADLLIDILNGAGIKGIDVVVTPIY